MAVVQLSDVRWCAGQLGDGNVGQRIRTQGWLEKRVDVDERDGQWRDEIRWSICDDLLWDDVPASLVEQPWIVAEKGTFYFSLEQSVSQILLLEEAAVTGLQKADNEVW